MTLHRSMRKPSCLMHSKCNVWPSITGQVEQHTDYRCITPLLISPLTTTNIGTKSNCCSRSLNFVGISRAVAFIILSTRPYRLREIASSYLSSTSSMPKKVKTSSSTFKSKSIFRFAIISSIIASVVPKNTTSSTCTRTTSPFFIKIHGSCLQSLKPRSNKLSSIVLNHNNGARLSPERLIFNFKHNLIFCHLQGENLSAIHNTHPHRLCLNKGIRVINLLRLQVKLHH